MAILAKHTDYIAALESAFSSICDLVVCFVSGSTMEPENCADLVCGSTMEPDNLYWPRWWLHHGASTIPLTLIVAS